MKGAKIVFFLIVIGLMSRSKAYSSAGKLNASKEDTSQLILLNNLIIKPVDESFIKYNNDLYKLSQHLIKNNSSAVALTAKKYLAISFYNSGLINKENGKEDSAVYFF